MRSLIVAASILLPLSLPAQDVRADEVALARALREVRAIRDADAVVLAHVQKVHPSPGVWCGIVMTWQEVTWTIETVVGGVALSGDLRVGHLLVGDTPMIRADEPCVRSERIWKGARAILCLTKSEDRWLVQDEDYGVRLIDGPKRLDVDRTAMVQALLDLPGLRPYLHLDRVGAELPQIELGPHILLPGEVHIGERALSFLPAELARDRRVLSVTALSIDGDRARLAFRFDAEGVRGEIGFLRTDGLWRVEASQVDER